MFITIDGPDGSGKTTIARKLAEILTSGEKTAVYTCEPTRSELGNKIREILKDVNSPEAVKLTEYFIADRKSHVLEIEELVKSGKIVICDRYKYSTVVYQSLQGEDFNRLIELNKDFPEPDYAFILNAKISGTLKQHIKNRGIELDFFEKDEEKIAETIKLYDSLKDYYPDLIYINAEQTLEKVLNDLAGYIKC